MPRLSLRSLLPEDPQESLKEWITFRCKLWGEVDQFWVQFNKQSHGDQILSTSFSCGKILAQKQSSGIWRVLWALCFSIGMGKVLVGILLLISWNIMAAYSLHIKRENQITVSEWLAICERDSSLTVQHVAKAMNPETGETIEIQTPNACVWTSPILRKKYYFTLSNGSITLGTDKAQIKKAKKLAKLLGAKLVGDEGEEY